MGVAQNFSDALAVHFSQFETWPCQVSNVIREVIGDHWYESETLETTCCLCIEKVIFAYFFFLLYFVPLASLIKILNKKENLF